MLYFCQLDYGREFCEYQTTRCETGINKQDCVNRLSEYELL